MSSPATGMSLAELQRAARDHLWLHFTRMGGVRRRRRADHRARRGLLPRGLRTASATSTRSRACSRCRSATRTATRSARPRTSRCASCPSTRTGRTRTRARSSSPPRSPSLAPGDLNRVFFVSGGSEAVESAWKLARQYHSARGERRWKACLAQRRLPRHDDGRAVDQRHPRAARAVRAARAGGRPRPQHEPLPPARRGRPRTEFTAFLLDDLDHAIRAGGPRRRWRW